MKRRDNLADLGDHASEARAQLLADISAFLIDHKLDVTPEHLFLAHQAFSGAHAGFAQQVTARLIAREEITAKWLAETAQTLGIAPDRKAELDRMMRRLEEVLESFLTTSHSASDAASHFGAAMASHAREAERFAKSSTVIDGATLVELTRAMIDRTREVEADMVRAEEETKCLRDRLKRAQRDARVDHLTGLPNRRAFDALYERECREARAASEDLCVALCDLDNFKMINDTYGHGVGDRVIRAVAKHFKSLSNNRCHVARHGGEEFVLLFRGLDVEAAAEKLDSARAAFAARRLVNRESEEPLGQVTYSGGVTDVFAHNDGSDALKAADVALYAAKSAGRNCVRIG
jgi:diguanylate cyclase